MDRVRDAMSRFGPAVAFTPPGEAPAELPFGNPIPAAVLVALFEEAGEARVILTRRSDQLRSHTGEVSFPGGRLEPDEPAISAALREASEEVGLDPSTVEILGELSPLATLSSRSGITPFVGELNSRPSLHPNPAEVELAFDIALADLLTDGVYREELWQRADMPGGVRSIHFFDLPEDIIWGATARILRELLDLIIESPLTGEDGDENGSDQQGG
jgi:8-oxo-dGTP pyrophosphatase MutT (NUDIX family)